MSAALALGMMPNYSHRLQQLFRIYGNASTFVQGHPTVMPEPKIVPLEVEAFRQHGGVFRDLKRRVLSIDFAEAEFEAKDSLPARP